MHAKIAIVANTPESFRFLLRAQLDCLREEGFEVHCVSGPGPYTSVLRRDGFVIHEVPLTRLLRPRDDLRALTSMVGIFRRERFALVHTHTPKAAILGQLASRMAGIEHIVNTVHGLLAHDATPFLRRLVLEPVDRLMCGLSTAVLSQSAEDVERAIRRHICRRDKIRTLGQGIELARFDPSRFSSQRRREIRHEFGIPRHALVVTMVARFSAEKGYREFFVMAREIASRRGDVHFVIVGTTLDERDPVHVRPDSHDLQGRLTVLTDRTDMPDILSIADLVVLPTYREGFPRSLVEAATMGIPVVSTRIRGCREAVTDGETGLLVAPRDASALVDAVELLLEDGERRRRMGAQARRRACREFDERRVCERVLALYHGLLNAPAKRSATAPLTWKDTSGSIDQHPKEHRCATS